jgi:hypothetical protein
MPINTQKLITLTRVNADKSVTAYYPKTVSSQVYLTDTLTVKDHVDNTNIHLSAAERLMFTNMNQANGLVQLDSNGFVPTSNINPAVLAITTEFADIAAMLASTGVEPGQLVWVNDASADTTVTSGWAIYRKRVGTGIDYTELTGWTKVAEAESLDVVVQWDNIQGKPSSTPAQIDQAVTDDHTHANKSALDDLADATTGTAPDEVVGLTYKGEAVAFQSEVSHLALATEANVDTVAAGMAENDIIFVVTNDNYSFPV